MVLVTPVDQLLPESPPVGDPDWNPLLAEWTKLGMVKDSWGGWTLRWTATERLATLKTRGNNLVNAFEMREVCCHKYAWAIPTAPVLEAIAEWGPIVEIGAGAGYWAALLRLRGVDIVCYDRAPPGSGNENIWVTLSAPYAPVHEGGAEKAAQHPGRTLFLCWPPYNEPMAAEALAAYEGDRLVFIGEGNGGCTGDEPFWEAIERDWDELRCMAIPQWYGLHDSVTFYRRKRS